MNDKKIENDTGLSEEELELIYKNRLKKTVDNQVDEQLKRIESGLGLSPHLYLNGGEHEQKLFKKT